MSDRGGAADYMSIHDTASALSTTHLKVIMLIKQRALEAIMEGEEWRVAASSVECLKTHGINPAHQASCRTSCTASGCHCK